MKQLNIAIPDDALAVAKHGAEARGMLLRRWVEAAIRSYGSETTAVKRPPSASTVSGFRCPNGCALNARSYRFGDQCITCLALLVRAEAPEREYVPLEDT